MNRIAALAGVGVVLALAACGPKVSTNSQGDVTVSNNGTTITAGKRPPANLPGWLKVYPGATVTTGAVLGQGGMLGFDTTDSPDKIVAFYNDIAKANGIAVNTDAATETSRAVDYRAPAPSKLNFVLTVASEGGKNHVAILYGPQS